MRKLSDQELLLIAGGSDSAGQMMDEISVSGDSIGNDSVDIQVDVGGLDVANITFDAANGDYTINYDQTNAAACANGMLASGGMGAALGAAIGGAIGSALPGAGTAAGALLGAALLGGVASGVSTRGNACTR